MANATVNMSSSDPVENIQITTPSELGQHISWDTEKFKCLGQKAFAEQRHINSDTSLDNVHHPAQHHLEFYNQWGAPEKFSTEPWSYNQISSALARGAHKSCLEHLELLHDKFTDMIQKGQWVILSASDVKDFSYLRVSPPC